MELDTLTAQILLGLGTNIAATIIGVIVAIAIRDRYYFRRLYYGRRVRVIYGDRELLPGGRSIDWNTAKTISESTAEESVLLKGIVSPYARLHCDLITEGRDKDLLLEENVPKKLIGRRNFGQRRTYTIDLRRGEAEQLLTIESLTRRLLGQDDRAGDEAAPEAREEPLPAEANEQDAGETRLINFSHPLTAEQPAAIARLTGQPIAEVREEPTQTKIEHEMPPAEQARAIVDGFGLSPRERQTGAILVNLPSYAPATAAVPAVQLGRMGYFPAVVRLRPTTGSAPTRYEVAEIVNLKDIRDASRRTRNKD